MASKQDVHAFLSSAIGLPLRPLPWMDPRFELKSGEDNSAVTGALIGRRTAARASRGVWPAEDSRIFAGVPPVARIVFGAKATPSQPVATGVSQGHVRPAGRRANPAMRTAAVASPRRRQARSPRSEQTCGDVGEVSSGAAATAGSKEAVAMSTASTAQRDRRKRRLRCQQPATCQGTTSSDRRAHGEP